jgi:hypothetical protein
MTLLMDIKNIDGIRDFTDVLTNEKLCIFSVSLRFGSTKWWKSHLPKNQRDIPLRWRRKSIRDVTFFCLFVFFCHNNPVPLTINTNTATMKYIRWCVMPCGAERPVQWVDKVQKNNVFSKMYYAEQPYLPTSNMWKEGHDPLWIAKNLVIARDNIHGKFITI